MSNTVKTYFLAPSWDYPAPPKGPIRLGNIIASPSKPVPALNVAQHIAPTGDDIMCSAKKGVVWSREKLRVGNLGVWTEFLNVLGLGVDVGVNWDRRHEEVYAFDRMETTEFFPTETYLKESMRAPAVIRHIQKSRFKKDVYMITGIKTVFGAKAKSVKSRTHGGELGVSLGGTLTGSPISVGPEAGIESKHAEGTAFEDSDDFVFAFRVRKVLVEKRGEIVQENFTKGAMFGIDKAVKEDEGPPFTVTGLAARDASAEDFGFGRATEVADSNDEACVCVAVR